LKEYKSARQYSYGKAVAVIDLKNMKSKGIDFNKTNTDDGEFVEGKWFGGFLHFVEILNSKPSINTPIHLYIQNIFPTVIFKFSSAYKAGGTPNIS
jgi:hypothetical protein